MSKHSLDMKTDHKKLKIDTRFICKPLDDYSEIMLFLENPPPWRTLCKELTPHSDFLIRNVEINTHSVYRSLENPENFCHFDPDSEDVKRYDAKSLPKTLVCHDMANGYHDDCIIDGTCNSEAYTFYNWAGIDIFCYFSHHLVTIPPLGWINVGHAHGVKVIGTIITEWADGITFWEEALASEVQYQNLASALVAIAKTLKFDGYLLNVENKITNPEALLQFVRYLHRLVHEELPHGTLLWYDSVTINGNLNWQNKLNEKNKAFFDACDGLFTNYSWSPEDVAESARAAAAAGRPTDLYVGVDVWGRNFYGGGQFNTQEAVKVAHAHGCSLALFAPAWTHEALAGAPSDANSVAAAGEPDGYGHFLLRDRALWGSLWPFLNTRLPCRLPFHTSFCRGHGKKRCLYGEVLSPAPWFNLRHQQYQPNAAHGAHGYALSSVEQLARVPRDVPAKDRRSIMRPSVQQSPQELATLNTDTALPFNTSIESVAEADGSTESVVRSEDAKSVRKAKGKALKMSKQKNIKIADDEVDSAATGSAQAEAEPSASTDASMVQMSVNLRLGTADKARYCLRRVRDERECLQLYLQDSFTGGACLKVNPSDRLSPEHRLIRLFHCDFLCEEGLIFCVVTKTLRQYADQTLNVKLLMKNAAGEDLSMVLVGRSLTQAARPGGAASGCVWPLQTAAPPVLRALRTYLLLAQPDCYVPVDNLYGWAVRYYEVSAPGARVTSVTLRTGLPQGGILLGHLGICPKTNDKTWMGSLENSIENTVDAPVVSVAPVAPTSYQT